MISNFFFFFFYCLVAQSCLTESPQTVAHQAYPSMGFSRQECWSGLPLPSPGDLPDPGIEPVSPVSPALAGGFFTTELLGRPNVSYPEPPILVYSHLLCLLFFSPSGLPMTPQ